MTELHEARHYEALSEGRVLCTLCPHDCRIKQDGRGACGVRYNKNGMLYTLVYDRIVSRSVEPVEKKPLYHFYPGSTAYSVATVGCSMRCTFCQNWDISQWPKEHLPKRLAPSGEIETQQPICPQLAELEATIPGEQVTPEAISRGGPCNWCDIHSLHLHRADYLLRTGLRYGGAGPGAGAEEYLRHQRLYQ